MCGIAGYFGKGDKETLKKMVDLVKHRGPDDEGYYIDDQVGLGHRRLSIIDLKSGHQPIGNEDGKIQLIYNGEIYNYKELKEELIKFGHKFRTNSDSEVIVHSYEEWGCDCFSKFNGMFAIAIWDENKKKLILARDRYGKKPVYWTCLDNTLIFASELKSILVHPLAKRRLNYLAIYQYFSFDYIPQPLTIFEDIYKLENGSILVFENNQISISKFYEIKVDEEKIDFKSTLIRLEELLEDSINKRLIADVPLGIFLSGGIDSSAIAYFAKKQKKDIETFSIGFSEKSFDETRYAKQAAELLKTNHHHKEFQPKDLLEIIPEVIEKLDEPFGDPSILPTYLLSKFTREKVKVALGGDGGDELLMGYPNHRVQKIIYFLNLHNLKFKTDYARILERLLPVSNKNLTFFYKVKRYSHSLGFSGLYRDFLNVGAYFNEIKNLFRFEVKPEELLNFADDFLRDYRDKDYLRKVNLLFLKYYLQDDILFKVDRASMYNSLEVRAPFLDFRLADFINSLPLNYKLRGLETKYIFKKLMKDKLPRNIVYRKKKGFGAPLTVWLKKDLKDYMCEILSKDNFRNIDFINHAVVDNLIRGHLRGKIDNRKILWNLIIFRSWYENYLV